jgi:transposase
MEMKCIGTIKAATIVSEIGNIEKFESAVKFQSYDGKTSDMSGSAWKTRGNGRSRTGSSHLSNEVPGSTLSLILHSNHEFYELFTRELMKKKSKTDAHIVVGRELLFNAYSMVRHSRSYR